MNEASALFKAALCAGDLAALRQIPKADLHNHFMLGGDREWICLLYTSPSPRDRQKSRMPSSA